MASYKALDFGCMDSHSSKTGTNGAPSLVTMQTKIKKQLVDLMVNTP